MLGWYGALSLPESRILTPESCSSHLRPTTYLLSFQQHSSFQGVTIFVFYNIPGLAQAVESLSFVFIDIPAWFVHFLKLRSPLLH